MVRQQCRRIRRFLPFSVVVFGLTLMLFMSSSALAADQKAVVQTTASDYTSAAHAVVNVNPVGGPRSSQLNLFAQSATDWIIRSYGDYFYLIGRYYSDSVARFHIDNPATPLYQESVLAGGEVTSNPHDMIFVNAEKAYMPMYALTSCWTINPQTGLRTGSIDLSSYGGTDGIPEMHTGVIVGDKLFLLIQNLDRNTWGPDGNGYLAVIDLATDTEIDTTGGIGAVKGIELPGKNPVSIQYLPENNTIYIACVGVYPGYGTTDLYTGGIVTVNPDTYGATLLVDDGEVGTGDADHPYGAISGAMVVSAAKGYFVGYKGWGDNYLYSFNPTSGAVDAGSVSAFDGSNLSPMDSGLAVDENGLLWISIGGGTGNVAILDTSTDVIDETVNTNLDPAVMAFCPPTIMADSNQANAGSGTGTISFAATAGTLQNMAGAPEEDYSGTANKPSGVTFVDGLATLGLTGIAEGASVQVTITWPSTPGDDAAYHGVDGSGFYEFDTAGLTRNANVTILTLTDGGYGDSDGVENGTITHTGGWAWTVTSGGGGGSSSGGGGGCFIGTAGSLF